jgi:hypothetical protein
MFIFWYLTEHGRQASRRWRPPSAPELYMFRNLTEHGRQVFQQEGGLHQLYLWDWGPNAGTVISYNTLVLPMFVNMYFRETRKITYFLSSIHSSCFSNESLLE